MCTEMTNVTILYVSLLTHVLINGVLSKRTCVNLKVWNIATVPK